MEILQLAHAVTIDGDLSEWSDQEPVTLVPAGGRNVEFGFVRSEADASVEAYLGWDDDRFYVAGVVRDDQHGKALDAAGVARVLNPFTDAADYAARSLLEELGGERTGGLQ